VDCRNTQCRFTSIEQAGQRSFLVAQSLYHAQEAAKDRALAAQYLGETPSTSDTLAQEAASADFTLPQGFSINADVDDTVCSRRAAVAAQRLVWFQKAWSPENLRLVGDVDYGARTTISGASAYASLPAYTGTVGTCGSLSTPGVTPALGQFGALQSPWSGPIDVAIQRWTAALWTFTKLGFVEPGYRPSSDFLSRFTDQLIATIGLSERAIADRSFAEATRDGTVITALGIVAVIAVLLLYVFVVYRSVSDLAREDRRNKKFLLVIPPDVREQVPSIAEFLETGQIDTDAENRRKMEMNERLLKNILPPEISARVKGGERLIADIHPSVTMMFTDLVGFTSLCSGKTAVQIVDFLNEIFIEFDLIASGLKLEKIKTIGDAYFMAGGLNPSVTDHGVRMVEAALMMFQALDEHNVRHLDRSPLQMRLGIHTGMAVAGVLGTQKVAYDLWGPEVPIANQMESTGVPQKVHISETTLVHVKGVFEVEPRNPEDLKDRPAVFPSTYLVTGRLLPTPYQHMFLTRSKQQLVGPAVERAVSRVVGKKKTKAGGSSSDE